MILTCPQCDTQFNLDSQILGANGKNVRCSSCRHSWFQDPEEGTESDEEGDIFEDSDESAESEEPIEHANVGDAAEDIPEAVKPKPTDDDTGIIPEQKSKELPLPLIGGVAGAAFVFLLIFGILSAMHQTIVIQAPWMNSFYGVFGYEPIIPGQGLVMDRLEMHQEKGVYTISGHIINLTSGERAVPQLQAALLDVDGNILETSIINPPHAIIAKEETMAFEAKYHPKTNKAKDIRLRFILTHAQNSAPHSNDHSDDRKETNTQEEPAHHDKGEEKSKQEHHEPPEHHVSPEPEPHHEKPKNHNVPKHTSTAHH